MWRQGDEEYLGSIRKGEGRLGNGALQSIVQRLLGDRPSSDRDSSEHIRLLLQLTTHKVVVVGRCGGSEFRLGMAAETTTYNASRETHRLTTLHQHLVEQTVEPPTSECVVLHHIGQSVAINNGNHSRNRNTREYLPRCVLAKIHHQTRSLRSSEAGQGSVSVHQDGGTLELFKDQLSDSKNEA